MSDVSKVTRRQTTYLSNHADEVHPELPFFGYKLHKLMLHLRSRLELELRRLLRL